VIHVKKTRSERIADTVWFKHKYITQPKVRPADQIVKAINDLTCALKGKNNVQSIEQMEALQKLEELLTKSSIQEEESTQAEQEPRVTLNHQSNHQHYLQGWKLPSQIDQGSN